MLFLRVFGVARTKQARSRADCTGMVASRPGDHIGRAITFRKHVCAMTFSAFCNTLHLTCRNRLDAGTVQHYSGHAKGGYPFSALALPIDRSSSAQGRSSEMMVRNLSVLSPGFCALR